MNFRGIFQDDKIIKKCQNNNMYMQSTNVNRADLRNFVQNKKMIQILNKKGIKGLMPIQYETFDLIFKGEDIVAKDRTGSGKTIAFSLPVVQRMRSRKKFKGTHFPKFLIVLPTRQLSIQVRDQIQSLKYKDEQDFHIVAVYGGNQNMQSQIKLIQRGADIITGTPGRIIDLMKRNVIIMDYFEVICLDQADQMLKIDFKADIEDIFRFITKSRTKKIQCLMFSATIPNWIWQMSDIYQSKNRKFIDMIKDDKIKTSKTVKHYCLYSDHMDKQYYIASLISYLMKGKNGKIIVFCQTKRDVDRIGRSRRIPASVAMLHGDFSQSQREKVFQNFKYGQVQCLIATNVAARGLDFPQIDLIIQMQPPTTTESYIHRSGRTGRVGRDGMCVTLYCYRQQYLMQRIQRQASIIFSHIDPREIKPIYQQQRNNRQDKGWFNNRNQNRRQSQTNSYNSRQEIYQKGYGRQNYIQQTRRNYDRRYQNHQSSRSSNYPQEQGTKRGGYYRDYEVNYQDDWSYSNTKRR